MQIGYFAPMSGRRSGGPETYDTCLARALAAIDAENQYTVFCVTPGAEPRFRLRQSNFRFRTLWPANRAVSVAVTLPIELMRRPLDVLHATYVPPPWMPGQLVLTVLDLSPFSHPQLYPAAIRLRLQALLSFGIRRAARILAISDFTRDCVLEQFKLAPERVRTTPLAVDERFRVVQSPDAVDRILAKYKIDRPYVVYVGKLQARKNITRILEAFDRVRREARLPHRLVLVGREIWDTRAVFSRVQELQLGPFLQCTGHVPDDDLPALYRGADALLYPSLLEGFGIPVLEAMACGTPVVTSTTTALPEVAGDAAILVDPESVDEIAAGLHRVLTDEATRGQLRRRGLERASGFSWERTARLTLETYQELAPRGYAVSPANPVAGAS